MRATLLTLFGVMFLLSTPLDSTAQDRARRTTESRPGIVWDDGRDGEWIRVRDRDGDLVWGRVLRQRNGDRVVVLRDGRVIVLDDRDRGRQVRRGDGPAFCRSGAGHPVHGRRWCLEHGFGLGRDRDQVWDRGRDHDDDSEDGGRVRGDRRRGTWGDVIFGDERRGRSNRDDDDSDD